MSDPMPWMCRHCESWYDYRDDERCNCVESRNAEIIQALKPFSTLDLVDEIARRRLR